MAASGWIISWTSKKISSQALRSHAHSSSSGMRQLGSCRTHPQGSSDTAEPHCSMNTVLFILGFLLPKTLGVH
jgi:hypothetical protein